MSKPVRLFETLSADAQELCYWFDNATWEAIASAPPGIVLGGMVRVDMALMGPVYRPGKFPVAFHELLSTGYIVEVGEGRFLPWQYAPSDATTPC